MATDWLFWTVALVFFLPLHLGAPALYLLLQGEAGKMRQTLPPLALRAALVACVGFAVAMLLWPRSIILSVLVLAIVLAHPWVELLLRSRKGS